MGEKVILSEIKKNIGIQAAEEALKERPLTWLVTGAAGFIGSHLALRLLTLGQRVIGFDNYSTGYRDNIETVRSSAGASAENFRMIEGDITDHSACLEACKGADRILHMAALGSVPRSMEDPLSASRTNSDGFVSILTAAKEQGIKRVVYASSSSVYGDGPKLPKEESDTALPLSPYALTKQLDEQWAELFTRIYGMECVGLRYFNVFGARQDPNGAYAAVIPRWFDSLRRGVRPVIYGDGLTSRDFCHIDNVVAANILASVTTDSRAFGEAFNVACGERTTLNELFAEIRAIAGADESTEPIYEDFRSGDIAHSLADITKAESVLGYEPSVRVREGLRLAAEWYLKNK